MNGFVGDDLMEQELLLYVTGQSKTVSEFPAVKNALYLIALDDNPFSFQPIGNEFRYTNRLGEAIRAYELNAQLFPGSARTHKSLASAYEDAGNRDGALAEYRKVLVIQPDDADAAKKIATLEKR